MSVLLAEYQREQQRLLATIDSLDAQVRVLTDEVERVKPGETGLPIESSETQITLYTALYQQLVEARVELEGERARLDKLRETIEQARGELEVAEAKLAQSMERRQVELLMEGVSEGYLLAPQTTPTQSEHRPSILVTLRPSAIRFPQKLRSNLEPCLIQLLLES